MEIHLPKFKKEYCCSNCGLIWFEETVIGSQISCPECKNNNEDSFVYDCSSMNYAYAYDAILENLKLKGKKIHYHKDHIELQKKYMDSLYK